MKILLVAATDLELNPIKEKLQWPLEDKKFSLGKLELESLVGGVGMVATAYEVGVHLAKNPCDLAINVGLTGSFLRNLSLGDVLQIEADQFSELGAEDDQKFLSVFKLGLQEKDRFPYQSGWLKEKNSIQTGLPKLSGITVNTVHGKVESISKIRARLQPHTESMEGAAFFYACLKAEVDCLQIRAISNYVEKRNRSGWNIPLALANLSDRIAKLLIHLKNEN